VPRRCPRVVTLSDLQKDSPGPENESNWLPVSDTGVLPMFRLYWPKEVQPSVLDGS
jgi:hypothetical protein